MFSWAIEMLEISQLSLEQDNELLMNLISVQEIHRQI